MIFVTVGNANQHFRRLLDAIDELAGAGRLKEHPVIVQSGSNSYFASPHCTRKDFFPPDEYRKLIDEADVIVCHGGAGTLHHVFQAGKIPVVMPRRRKYGEHVEDQFEFVSALLEQGRVIAAFEPNELSEAISRANDAKQVRRPARPSAAIQLIESAIRELCPAKTKTGQ
ncbi:MAG TPA: glycosyltransferase [Pyrinomonadaceae bacterium]|nr:glycosyltransferase [Pyrinomonadaceae bacterium]